MWIAFASVYLSLSDMVKNMVVIASHGSSLILECVGGYVEPPRPDGRPLALPAVYVSSYVA